MGRLRHRNLRLTDDSALTVVFRCENAASIQCGSADGNLCEWNFSRTHATSKNVIVFFDRLVDQVACKTIVVRDNAPIHRGEAMREKQAEWEKKGLSLFYLPPYSPELNAIEILWKQAKYFWRRFLALSGLELQREIEALMQGYGSEYTITFQ